MEKKRMSDLAEQYQQQTAESVKLVLDLTSRIDERVKMLVENHSETANRVEKLMERHENILSRISVLENKSVNSFREDIVDIKKELKDLEIKLSVLQINNDRHENKWKTIGDFVFKIAVSVIGAIIAIRLGVQ